MGIGFGCRGWEGGDIDLCFGQRSGKTSLPPNLLRKASLRELKNTMTGERF